MQCLRSKKFYGVQWGLIAFFFYFCVIIFSMLETTGGSLNFSQKAGDSLYLNFPVSDNRNNVQMKITCILIQFKIIFLNTSKLFYLSKYVNIKSLMKSLTILIATSRKALWNNASNFCMIFVEK